MKVLFLDHDGVICLSSNYGSRFKKNKGSKNLSMHEIPIEDRFDNFDKKAIKVLNDIITETNCEIVISSDWKNWATVEEMGLYYIHQGIIKKPLDFTSFINDIDIPKDYKWTRFYDREQERVVEIEDWLSKNEVEKWVAVDDLHLGITKVSPSGTEEKNWGLENFVWCPAAYEGIKQTGIKQKIIEFLT